MLLLGCLRALKEARNGGLLGARLRAVYLDFACLPPFLPCLSTRKGGKSGKVTSFLLQEQYGTFGHVTTRLMMDRWDERMKR